MPCHQMNELCKLEEDHQDPREAWGLVEEQLFWGCRGEDRLEGVAAAETRSPLQSPPGACPPRCAMAAPPWSQYEDEGSSSQEKKVPSTWEVLEDANSMHKKALQLKMTEMVEFLLLKYHAKKPTTEAEILSSVIREYQDHFPEILSQDSQCMQLVFGIELRELGPSDHPSVLVSTLDLIFDEMVSDGHRFPNTGLLATLLWVTVMEGDCATEEEVWEALDVMGVHNGKEHWIYGEPRELITKVWVQEKYLVYQQVPSKRSCMLRVSVGSQGPC
ncbi:melanoma-associated antigen 10-like [Glossophaga mutica]